MAEEIGVAYLSVKPKVDNGFDAELEGAGSAGGKSFGGAFTVAAGNLIANAVSSIASTVTDTFKNAFQNFADYEQLVGGVDTLFKDSSAKVQQYAAKAYETAGLSANEYMEQVTSFSASLLQSLGGDTDKAADYADMAMRDMSDNANKMGTSMESITNAYQGFAKQNYTMLDNLKLGYGGTKEEMQRLLKDASEIAGVEFNIDSYSDVIQAIHVMQEQMGIAGTTAEEGSATISGSIGKLSASWQNFLTGLMDSDADIGALGEQVMASLGDVVRNVVPVIGTLVTHAVQELPGVFMNALSSLPSMLAPIITQVFGEQMGGQINSALGDGFGRLGEIFGRLAETVMPVMQQVGSTVMGILGHGLSILPALFPVFEAIMGYLQPIIELVMSAVSTALPLVQQAVGIVVDFITQKVLPLVQQIYETVTPVVQQISEDIQSKMPEISGVIETAMGLISNVIETAWPVISQVVLGAVQAISGIISTVWPVVSTIISTAMQVISTVIKTAWPVIKGIIETVSNVIKTVSETVWPAVSKFVEDNMDKVDGAIQGIKWIGGFIEDLFGNIQKFIEDPLGTAQGFIEDFASTIENIMGGLDLSLPDIALPHFNIWGGEFPFGIGGMGAAPEFSVDWYARGGMVDNATLIGAGERGAELIWPSYDPYLSRYADAIADRMGSRSGVDIHDCTFNVRKDSDIRRVAEELNTLINRQQAGAYA